MSYISDLKTEQFDELILQTKAPSLVHFSAAYCRSCKKYSKVLEDLGKDNDLDFNIAEVDIQKNIELRRSFDIRLLPTTIFFSEGTIIQRKTGALSVEEIYKILYIS